MSATHRLTLLGAIVIGNVAICGIAQATPAGGHCTFEQYSPATHVWYPVCATPATQQTCDALQASNYRKSMSYAEGSCGGQVEPGGCELSDGTLYFYAGVPDDLAIGCQRQGGAWHPDQLPPQ